jgi:hypothetical protein
MKKGRRIFSYVFVISMIATFLVGAIPMGALQPKERFDEYNGSYVDFVKVKFPDDSSGHRGLIHLEDGFQGKQPFVLIYNDDNAEPAFKMFYEEVKEGRFKAAALNFTVGEHNTKMFVMTPESVYYIAQNYTVENGEEEIEIIKGNEQGTWLIPEVETPE